MKLTKFNTSSILATNTIRSRPKVALVDFDGVIIKSKTIQSHIVDRVNNYVSNVLKIESPDTTKRINKYIYETYGHTMIGLEKVAGPDLSGTLVDFNKFVYEDINIARDDFYEAKKELAEWQNFTKQMEHANIPIYIFSNAPTEWCLNFIDLDNIAGFVSDQLPKESQYLKPELKVFEVVHAWFRNNQVYFIDDKVHNMKHTVQKENWTNIIFEENQPRESFKLQDRLYVAKTLTACADIIS